MSLTLNYEGELLIHGKAKPAHNIQAHNISTGFSVKKQRAITCGAAA